MSDRYVSAEDRIRNALDHLGFEPEEINALFEELGAKTLKKAAEWVKVATIEPIEPLNDLNDADYAEGFRDGVHRTKQVIYEVLKQGHMPGKSNGNKQRDEKPQAAG